MTTERFIIINETRIKDTKSEWNHTVQFNNRKDAINHCNWLNRKEKAFTESVIREAKYFTGLRKIGMICESIEDYTEEIYTLEKIIQIKKLLKEVIG